MATVTGFTAERMQEIEDGAIVDGNVVGDDLILIRRDLGEINAGSVVGPTGETGPAGAGGIEIVTSGTNPSGGDLYEGLAIYETDTDKFLIYNGVRFDRPWNMPWGIMDYAQVIADSAAFTNAAVVNLVVGNSITYVANRRIRITVGWQSFIAANAELILVSIQEGATVLQSHQLQIIEFSAGTNGISDGGTMSVVITPTAAAHTYKFCGTRVGGADDIILNADSTYPAYVLVEDLGPNGVPA